MTIDGCADPSTRVMRFDVDYFTTRDKGTIRLSCPVDTSALSLEILAPISSRSLTAAATLYPVDGEPCVFEGAFDWSCIDFSDPAEFFKPDGKDAVPESVRPCDPVDIPAVLSAADGAVVATRRLSFRYLPPAASSISYGKDTVPDRLLCTDLTPEQKAIFTEPDWRDREEKDQWPLRRQDAVALRDMAGAMLHLFFGDSFPSGLTSSVPSDPSSCRPGEYTVGETSAGGGLTYEIGPGWLNGKTLREFFLDEYLPAFGTLPARPFHIPGLIDDRIWDADKFVTCSLGLWLLLATLGEPDRFTTADYTRALPAAVPVDGGEARFASSCSFEDGSGSGIVSVSDFRRADGTTVSLSTKEFASLLLGGNVAAPAVCFDETEACNEFLPRVPSRRLIGDCYHFLGGLGECFCMRPANSATRVGADDLVQFLGAAEADFSVVRRAFYQANATKWASDADPIYEENSEETTSSYCPGDFPSAEYSLTHGLDGMGRHYYLGSASRTVAVQNGGGVGLYPPPVYYCGAEFLPGLLSDRIELHLPFRLSFRKTTSGVVAASCDVRAYYIVPFTVIGVARRDTFELAPVEKANRGDYLLYQFSDPKFVDDAISELAAHARRLGAPEIPFAVDLLRNATPQTCLSAAKALPEDTSLFVSFGQFDVDVTGRPVVYQPFTLRRYAAPS